MTRAKPLLRRILKGLLVVLALAVVLPYAWGPIYRFPEPAPFSGEHIFNPYAALRGTWQRTNLHAHGRAWVGITNGQQPDRAVVDHYRELGYSVPGVSDYQRIAAHHGVATIPVYEHGFNIVKQHQLAIGAHEVEWFDFPLWMGRSHEQYVIDRVRRKTDLVAIAHPATRDAYTEDEVRALTGYNLMEIVNGPFAVPQIWDAALSAGHPVWAVANDDTHDLTDPKRTAAGWSMIDAPTPAIDDIVEALRGGRAYAVQRTGAVGASNVTVLDSVQVENGTVSVSINGAASTITFIGQNGAVRKTVKDAMTASYTLQRDDTYVRAVVDSPQTVLYLNPVVRYDGRTLPTPAATVDRAATWMLRGSFGVGCAMVVSVLARRRKRSPAPAFTRPVLAPAKRNTA